MAIMNFQFLCALLFLSMITFGVAVSLFYTILILHKSCFGHEKHEQSVSLLEAAKLSASTAKTPIFGEPAWFVLVGLVCLTLTFKAGWINSTKLVLQLEWQNAGADEVFWGIRVWVLSKVRNHSRSLQIHTFQKPLFLTFCALVGLAACFPFCGLKVETMTRDFVINSMWISTLHLSTVAFLALGLQFLPASTSIILRVILPPLSLSCSPPLHSRL